MFLVALKTQLCPLGMCQRKHHEPTEPKSHFILGGFSSPQLRDGKFNLMYWPIRFFLKKKKSNPTTCELFPTVHCQTSHGGVLYCFTSSMEQWLREALGSNPV